MSKLERNIRKAITEARKTGISGMSLGNLKQVTSTAGLAEAGITPEEYDRTFDSLALRAAASRRFTIIH